MCSTFCSNELHLALYYPPNDTKIEIAMVGGVGGRTDLVYTTDGGATVHFGPEQISRIC